MTEADLCARFVAACPGWTVYAETAGWDVLLVRRGIQVGVQAKLVANEHLLLQAMPNMGSRRHNAFGPHYRLVLVGRWPGRTDSARRANRGRWCGLAQHLRLLVGRPPENKWQTWFGGDHPSLNLTVDYEWRDEPVKIWWRWYRWRTGKPETLPIVVPQVPAGVPCPEKVTPWSIAAVLLERRCLERGHVTVADARELRDQASGTWNPSTMLTRYFVHRPPPNGRWIMQSHKQWWPSVRHPGTMRSLEQRFRRDYLGEWVEGPVATAADHGADHDPEGPIPGFDDKRGQ